MPTRIQLTDLENDDGHIVELWIDHGSGQAQLVSFNEGGMSYSAICLLDLLNSLTSNICIIADAGCDAHVVESIRAAAERD